MIPPRVFQLTTGPVDLDHEGFDGLAPSEKKVYRDRVLDAWASRLWQQEQYLAIQRRARAEADAAKAERKAAAVTAKVQFLTGQDLDTLAGRLRWCVNLGTCHLYWPERNYYLPPHHDAERLITEANQRGLDTFRLDLTLGHTAIVGTAAAVDRFRGIHELPESLRLGFEDGTVAEVFGLTRDCPRFSNPGHAYRFEWHLHFTPGTKVLSANLDPATAGLQKLPDYIAELHQDIFRSPDAMFKILERKQ